MIAEVTPPSSEASSSEASDSEASDSEAPDTEISAPEEDLLEAPASGETFEASATVEAEVESAPELDRITTAASDSATPDAIAPEDLDDETWIDETETDIPEAVSASATPVRPTQNNKPSLLAMPLILAGWVKDVAISLTKPKPSKPVIEIPRRESSVNRRAQEKETNADASSPPLTEPFDSSKPLERAKADNRYNDEPTATEPTVTEPTATEPTATEPTDDDWEESNWDD